jgi:hypothetical protein
MNKQMKKGREGKGREGKGREGKGREEGREGGRTDWMDGCMDVHVNMHMP